MSLDSESESESEWEVEGQGESDSQGDSRDDSDMSMSFLISKDKEATGSTATATTGVAHSNSTSRDTVRHHWHTSNSEADSTADSTELLPSAVQAPDSSRGCCRSRVLLVAVSVLLLTVAVSVWIPLAGLLDPLTVHLSLRFPSLPWALPAARLLPSDVPLPAESGNQRSAPFTPRRLDTQLSSSLAALYNPSRNPTDSVPSALPDLVELSSNHSSPSASPVRSLLSCLAAASTGTSSSSSSSSSASRPSLRRVGVVSSTQPAPSAVSLSLALRSSMWCVLVVTAATATANTAAGAADANATAAAVDSFHQLGLHDSLGLAATAEEEGERLAERLIVVSADELLSLPYASSARGAAGHWSMSRAKNVAYLLAIHAGADVVYDTDSAAPVVSSSDLPAMYMSHTFSIPRIDQRTVMRHTLSLPLPVDRRTRPPSNHSAVRPLSAGSSLHNISAVLLNPYPWLGHAELWPRGFPIPQVEHSLDRINASSDSLHEQYQHCLPVIQQLVPEQRSELDLDHHAEWFARMQHKRQQPEQQQEEQQEMATPPERVGLPFRSFAPVNGQSSVWLSSALSLLLLPVTVHPRVADIWRSYFAETLLSYGRVNNRPYDASLHSDSRQGADWAGPDGVSLLAGDIEPCVAFSRAQTLRNNRSASPAVVVDPIERPFAEEAERLIAFLASRQHGQPFDLLTRARQRIQPQQYGEVTQLHLMAELYADLYEAGLVEWDDVQAAIDWVTDMRSVAAVREADNARYPRRQDELNNPPYLDPAPSLFLPAIPHGQQAMAVCINFNFVPADNSLWQVLRYHSRLHDRMAVVLPVPFHALSAHQRHWFAHLFPQVHVLEAVEEADGRCQQYSLLRCLEWANSTGALLDGDEVRGVLYMADDMWFDFYEVLYPRSQHPDALPTFTNVSLFHTHLTYPLDEFWYPLPVMELNMALEADSVGNWEWLDGGRGPYFRFLKHVWRAWPQEWRDMLSSVIGTPDTVVTNAVADLVYVPTSRQQLHNLMTVLRHTLYGIPQPEWCVFSEVLLTQLVHLAMMLSGVQPAIPLPAEGPYYDRQYETLYFHPDRNATTLYAQLHRFLTGPPPRPSLPPLPPGNSTRVRPVPLRVDGYRWDRGDVAWLRRHVLSGDGDPVFLHPLKLSRGAGGERHEGYVGGMERMTRRMDEARRQGGRGDSDTL